MKPVETATNVSLSFKILKLSYSVQPVKFFITASVLTSDASI